MRDTYFQADELADPAGVIVAVVVTLNRLHQVQRTVERLLDSPLNQIVLVDNGSTDGTRDWLASLTEPRVTVELAEKNLGGAGGFARGIELAQDRYDPDWLLLLDDDARPRRDAVERFRALDLENWDAVAAAVYYPGGEICEMNRPSRNPFWSARHFLRTLMARDRAGFHVDDSAFEPGKITSVDVSSFVGLFVSRDAVQAAGLPQSRMFIYGDDVLFSLALRRNGGRMALASDIVFEHDCGARASHEGKRVRPIWKVYYLVRNKIVVYRDVAGPLFWLMLPALILRWTLRIRDYGEQGTAYRRLLAAGLRDGLSNRFSRLHADVRQMAED